VTETDWHRNLRAGPATKVQLGRDSFTPEHRFLTEGEAFDVTLQFRREHPHRLHLITRILGWATFARTTRSASSSALTPFIRVPARRARASPWPAACEWVTIVSWPGPVTLERRVRAIAGPGCLPAGSSYAFWHGHRALVRLTRGRLGLWRPKPDGWGTLRLTTTGRRTGRPRQVLVGYFEDGRDLVTMAMNGWGVAETSWWLNLQLIRRHRRGPVTDHDVSGTIRGWRERERLWSRWLRSTRTSTPYAARRPTETAVVVLEPRDGPSSRPNTRPPDGHCCRHDLSPFHRNGAAVEVVVRVVCACSVPAGRYGIALRLCSPTTARTGWRCGSPSTGSR
jgi:hypothetical protein